MTPDPLRAGQQPKVDATPVRQLAFVLLEAVEADHHGRPSFRVGGRIFATLPDAEHANGAGELLEDACERSAPERLLTGRR